ncbi:MAG: KH domain-containing protein [Actinomycetaceae bacterium]|nr:KH domain-containing protein [Arcanobacterium sp.]MDD7505449.1 KH domain-containing protein [Actinomycetaceae bacterium]
MNDELLDNDETKELKELLDEEGDLAADYLEELLDIADLDGDIEISSEADRATVSIVTEGDADPRLKRLIGRHGDTLDALQELTRLSVQRETGERSRLMLDVLGYRDQHRQRIQEIAQEAIDSVLETGDDYALKPMNPFERKVVHDAAAKAGLFSDSSGVGPARHVVISLPEDDGDNVDHEGSAEDVASSESASEYSAVSASSGSADSADSADSPESAASAE